MINMGDELGDMGQEHAQNYTLVLHLNVSHLLTLVGLKSMVDPLRC